MSGCTGRQLLWKVALPAAQPTLLLGLNQVVMQSLAMVVITSLIGAVGPRPEADVLAAAAADRRGGRAGRRDGGARRDPGPAQPGLRAPRAARPRSAGGATRTCSLALAGIAVSVAAGPGRAGGPRPAGPADALDRAPFWDGLVRWMAVNLYWFLGPMRDGLTAYVLLPLRNAILMTPWTMAVGLVALAGWRLGGAGLRPARGAARRLHRPVRPVGPGADDALRRHRRGHPVHADRRAGRHLGGRAAARRAGRRRGLRHAADLSLLHLPDPGDHAVPGRRPLQHHRHRRRRQRAGDPLHQARPHPGLADGGRGGDVRPAPHAASSCSR